MKNHTTHHEVINCIHLSQLTWVSMTVNLNCNTLKQLYIFYFIFFAFLQHATSFHFEAHVWFAQSKTMKYSYHL
jgi:hypothetical protein